jgi:hypothetical protein
MRRTRDREDLGDRAATLAAMATAVAVIMAVGLGTIEGAEAVASRKKLMSAGIVGSWAIGPGNVDLRQKKEQAHFTQVEEAALMVVRATLTHSHVHCSSSSTSAV